MEYMGYPHALLVIVVLDTGAHYCVKMDDCQHDSDELCIVQ